MKEELQSKLVEILGSIQTAAGKAGDFAMVQLPDIAQGYVLYGRAYTTFWLLLGLTGLVIGALTLRRGLAKSEKAKKDHIEANRASSGYVSMSDFDFGEFQMFSGGMGCAIFGFMAAISIQPAMLIWFAPKVWLLKEIAGLVK